MSTEPAGGAGEPTRPVLTRLNADGTYSAESATSSPDFKVRAECLVPSRLVIPIVFVPGIMGTRLRVASREDKAAWFPPEGNWEGIVQVLQSLRRDAAMRQQLLNPDTTEVDDNGEARPDPETAKLLGDAPGDSDAERAKWRGWGQLYAQSYGGILGLLEQRLARILADGCNSEPAWKAAVMDWQDDGKKKLGAQKPFTSLDDDALKRAASVFYPVHAVGYNWLQSNKASGERLAGEIRRILAHYAGHERVAERVIVVTHSMGGLVARACAQLEGMQDKILGIVHGVMPAIGAPASYKRMRAGFEGVEKVILGRDAAECTAVLANAPGPLELLPTRQYRTQDSQGEPKHWLRVSYAIQDGGRDMGRFSIALGEAEDPYGSIYLNNDPQCWWRLVKEELIDPAGREERDKAAREGKTPPDSTDDVRDFDRYAKNMKKVKDLQELLEDKYHPTTYAYYAADADRKSWNGVDWRCGVSETNRLSRGTTLWDNLGGEVTVKFGDLAYELEIDGPRGPGDGTVPMESGAAPTKHAKQIFRHEGKAGKHTSYQHQDSYKADIAQAVTLYSICRIAADSDWLQSNLHRA